MYKPLQIQAPKTRSLNRPPNIGPRRLVLGNCPQIQNKAKQKLYSNTKIFAFAKELLRVPNDCSQNVSHYIAVCLVHSLTLGLDFLVPYRQSTRMA